MNLTHLKMSATDSLYLLFTYYLLSHVLDAFSEKQMLLLLGHVFDIYKNNKFFFNSMHFLRALSRLKE